MPGMPDAREEAHGDAGRLGALITGYNATQVVRVIAKLAVPDHLDGGPQTAEELASITGAASGPLRRLLCAAAVFGLVTQDESGRFALTPMGGHLRTDVPGSVRSLAIGFTSAPLWRSFGELGEVVATGQLGAGIPGGIWEHFRQHPEDAVWFSRAMSRFTEDLVRQLPAVGYGLPRDAQRVVDVGGGRGTLLACLLGTAPAAKGAVLDRAEALAEAPAVFAAAGVADRAETIEGDFFGTVPAGDVHVLCNILHDWSDERAGDIVASCHRASRPGGLLVVIGLLLPAGPEPSMAHLMDLQMMVMMEGGRERTLAEHQSLMASAGYEFSRDIPIPGVVPAHILEFRAS
jgi:SAM-dependent methyltransferase